MAEAGRCTTQWLKRPLSRHYGLVFIDVEIVRLREAQGVQNRHVHWAFGWLPDGEGEALGAWLDLDGGVDPSRLLSDLQARGVERIRHLAGTGHGTGESPEGVSKSVQLEAEQVRAGVNRAIRRQGCFAIESAVLDFMADALQRAERRLDRERLVAKGQARLDSGVQMAPSGI